MKIQCHSIFDSVTASVSDMKNQAASNGRIGYQFILIDVSSSIQITCKCHN